MRDAPVPRRRRDIVVLFVADPGDDLRAGLTWDRPGRGRLFTNVASPGRTPDQIAAETLRLGAPGDLREGLPHQIVTVTGGNATLPLPVDRRAERGHVAAVVANLLERRRSAGKRRPVMVIAADDRPWTAAAIRAFAERVLDGSTVVAIVALGPEGERRMWIEWPHRTLRVAATTPIVIRLAAQAQVAATLRRAVGGTAVPGDLRPLEVDRSGYEPIQVEAATGVSDIVEGVLALGERPGWSRLADPPPISFIVAVIDDGVLRHNLLRGRQDDDRNQWLIVDNRDNRAGDSLSAIYEETRRRAVHDLQVFIHQDTHLPAGWEHRLAGAIAGLDEDGVPWGVLGGAGVRRADAAFPEFPWEYRGHHADSSGYSRTGPLPVAVDALDEMWLAMRASSGLRFDPDLPGFHCYGPDIALTARDMGLEAVCIDAFCWHEARLADGSPNLARTEWAGEDLKEDLAFIAAYRPSYDYVGAKWAHRMPFASTSAKWGVPGRRFAALDAREPE